MGKSPHAKADRIEGAEQGHPVRFNSGRMTSVNGQVRYFFVAPFSGYVTRFDLNISTVFTNAAATAFMGTAGDANNDDLLNDHAITNVAAGTYDLIGDDNWVTKAVVKGTEYAIGFTNADATGVGNIGVTITPGPGPLA
jgi:hypothetical protein